MELKLVHKLKIKILLSVYKMDLSDWEDTFLSFIQHSTVLTSKQEIKLNEIWNFFRSGRTHTEKKDDLNSPYSHELGLSYDDIHDFDK